MLFRDVKAEAPRQLARLLLGHVAQRKAQVVELVAGGRKQEIALVAIGIGRADKRACAVGQRARGNVVAGRERSSAEFARGLEQVAELDRTVAFDARHRRLARGVAVGKMVDHRVAEAALVVQHVMRNSNPCRDVACIVDVLAGAAGTLAMGGGAMIVELQRDADDVVAFGLQKRSRHRGIDAAGHGDDDPGILRPAFEIETVEHGLSH